MVLLMVCVLSVVASSMLLSTSARYETTFQSASWQEAIVSAEGGIDLAMSELRKRVSAGPSQAFLGPIAAAANRQPACWSTTAPNGSSYPNYGHALTTLAPQAFLVPLTGGHGGEGNTLVQARVYVDVPGSGGNPAANFAVPNTTTNNSFISQSDNPLLRDPDGVDRSRWWYRLRALGVASVSGPARPNLQKLDNRLRRFSLFSDWRTGDAVAAPQVSRLVEVLVEPETNFRNALMADQQINLSNQDVLIDSYDSSKGAYNAATHGTMGNIATNGQLINANNAVVDGNAMTNNGSVNQGNNVTGQQSGNFYQELTPFSAGQLNPVWSIVPDGGTVTASPAAPYVASADSANPTLVRLDGVNLSNGNTISINAPANSNSTAPSYIKVYVQGDLATSGAGQIVLAPNVNAIFYVAGNVNLQGSGIINNTQLARNLVVNGIQPPANADGTYPTRTINIATTQDFEGIIYAPNHDLNLALQAVPVSGSGSGSSSGAPVVTYTGSNPNIPPLVAVITQEANTGYNLQLDEQVQQAQYNKNGDQGAYQKLLQDQNQYNALLTAYNQNVAAVQRLGGTVTVTGSTVSSSSATDHALGYNGIYGGFVARTITVADKTHVHYDETLRTAGPVNHYEIVNWFEDNVSHGAVGSTTAFWWAGSK